MSSPVNTLVLEPGHYGFNDFVKVGLPLLVLTLIVTVAMVGVLYPFLKDEAGGDDARTCSCCIGSTARGLV
jgi:Na+/H+ antiporter NhaD/arsenite permease-like protein